MKLPKIVKRIINMDAIEDQKKYVITDPVSGKWATVRAEVTEQTITVLPRSVVFIFLAGDLPVGTMYDRYQIEEA